MTWTAGTLHCAYGSGAVSFHPPHVWTYTKDDGSTVDFNCRGQGEPPIAAASACPTCGAPTSPNGDSGAVTE